MIEVEGEPAVYIQMEPPPELVFELEGIQGEPGSPGPAGADIGGYDPGDLTLIFDNQLI